MVGTAKAITIIMERETTSRGFTAIRSIIQAQLQARPQEEKVV